MKLSLIAASLVSALALTQAASVNKFCEKKYEVSKGDTCQSIAEKFGLTEDHLKEWNEKLESDFDCSKLTSKKSICIKFPESIEKRSDKHDTKKKATTVKKNHKVSTTKKRPDNKKAKKTTKKDDKKKKTTKKEHKNKTTKENH